MEPTEGGPRADRVLLALLFAGALGLLLALAWWGQAFRWAALDLRMDRAQAVTSAETLLLAQGHDVRGHRRSAVFWSDETPIIFLEKTLGTREANRLVRDRGLPVWGWEVRFFKPLEKEEYRVWLDPRGQPIGFRHDILREKKLPSVAPEEARRMAEAGRARFPDSPRYRLVEQSSDEKTGRVDHALGFKDDDAPGGLRLYLRVTVSGNELTEARREVEVPESFERAERERSSRRSLLGQAAGLIDSLTGPAVLGFLLLAAQRRAVRPGLVFRLALVLLVFRLLGHANDLPQAWHGYSTEDTPGAFWTSVLVFPILGLVGSMLWEGAVFAAADAAGRLSPRAGYSLGELARPGFLVSAAGLRATAAGLGAAGVQLGYVVAFYVLGRRLFGLYSPADVPYGNVLSTGLPWIEPLLSGLAPALNEESVYRLFAVSLLLFLTRRWWIAITLPAVLWGFLHTFYYVEPIWSRGLELSLAGIFDGLVFLRFGIWATIVSHYVYNATVSSPAFLESASSYVRVSSAAVVLLPAVPFLLAFARPRPRAAVVAERLAWARPAYVAPAPPERRRVVHGPDLRLGLPLCLIAFAVLGIVLIPGAWLPSAMPLDRAAAIRAAREGFAELGFPLPGYRAAASFGESGLDSTAARYVRATRPREEARAWMERQSRREPRWAVRFFSPGQAGECRGSVGAAGRLEWFWCTLAEDAPGRSLDPEQSRRLAETFLAGRGLAIERLRYTGPVQQDRPHRQDVTHRWSDPSAEAGELRCTLSVGIADGRVASFSQGFQAPEAFLREESRSTVFTTMRGALVALVALVLALFLVRSLFDEAVTRRAWEPLAAVAALVTVVFGLLGRLNELPTLWLSYDTAAAPDTFLAERALGLVGSALGGAFAAYLLALLFLRLPPHVFASAPGPADVARMVRSFPWTWLGTRASFAWAAALVALLAAEGRMVGWLSGESAAGFGSAEYAAFSTAFPAATIVLGVPAVLSVAGLPVLLAALRKYAPRWLLVALALAALVAMTPTRLESPWPLVGGLLSLATAAVVVFRVARFRLAFYLWIALLGAAFPFLPWLFTGHGPPWRQGLLVLAGLLALTLAVFIPWRRPRPPA